jgi:hypothetical protein
VCCDFLDRHALLNPGTSVYSAPSSSPRQA